MIIEDYLQQKCYKMSNGIDGWNKPIMMSEPTTLKCQWVEKFKLIRDKTGKEIVSQIQVKLLSDCNLSVGELLSKDKANNYTIIAIEDKTDIFGNVQLKVAYC